jgi:hypothetical protein
MESIRTRFNERYQNLNLDRIDRGKLWVSCKRCSHSWPTSEKNAFIFYLGCYNCHKGKGYSMDEIKILRYLQDNYLLKDELIYQGQGQGKEQKKIFPVTPKNLPLSFKPKKFYTCDGFTKMTYSYVSCLGLHRLDFPNRLGTVFEVLGDYCHSNPHYYPADERMNLFQKDMTHKENYEYTMNRLKHIEEQGYKVFWIWISDFRQFTRDQESNPTVNLFDYMNKEKTYSSASYDRTLLSKESQGQGLKATGYQTRSPKVNYLTVE